MAKKKIAPKTAPLKVGDDEYLVRTNLPMRAIADLNSGDIDRVIAALKVAVVESAYEGTPGDWTDDITGPFLEAYGELLKAIPPA